ncbi:MAG: hypothetical protein Q4G58_11580 [bacterium]|nr:hypothetical protein [bacterium]
MARENFYLILELPFDPPEEDQAVIDRVIEKKRLEWSKGATDFKKGPVYRGYTSMLPIIREVMADPEKRKKEYEQAYKLTFDKARHMLAIVEKRGYLYESEIKSISKRLQVNENIVRCACKVRIVEDSVAENVRNKPESADKFQVFQVYLDTLNKKDYYDFINYNGTMKARLKDMPPFRLVELIRQQKIKYAKNTPEESAIEKLCAECEKTFASKESKQEYDDYLAWKNTEDVFEQIQIATELTKVLDDGQCSEAIKLLLEAVSDENQCISMLRTYCRQNGIAMEYRQSLNKNSYQGVAPRQRQEEKEAREEPKKAQPNMPKNLKVQVDTVKRCNYITWEKTSMDSNVNYLIVRKRGSAPRHINDGELLGTVSGSNYTDATLYPGKIYFYAVFAVKRGVYSKGISTQVGYLNLFEVQDAVISLKEKHVELEWVSNYRELRIAIFRQEGNAPMEYGSGRLCYNASQPFFKDADVKKAGDYYYRIFTTVYINGKRFASKGVVLHITVPEEKPVEQTRNRPKIVTRKQQNQLQPEIERPEIEPTQTERSQAEKPNQEAKPKLEPLPLRPPALNKPPEQKKPVTTLKSAKPVWPKEQKKELPPMKPNPYMKPLPRVEDKNSITYDIKVRKGIFKPKELELIFTGHTDNFVLPPLLIVGTKNYPPVYKESGVLIGTIEKQQVTKKYTHSVPLLSVEGLDYIKLFLANETDEGQYELHLKYGSSSKFT